MIYDLTSEAMLNSIVQIVESEINSDRIREHIKAFQTVSGNQRRIIDEEIIRKFPESHEWVTRINIKISDKIVRKLARVYSAGVIRQVIDRNTKEVDQDLTALLNEVYSDVDECDRNFDQTMERTNRYEINHEYVEVFSYIEPDTNKIRFKPLPQQLFTALPNQTKTKSEVIVFKNDYTHLTETNQFIDWDNTTEEIKNGEITGLYTVWSKEFHFDFARVKITETVDGVTSVIFKDVVLPARDDTGTKNPWGVYPFTQVKKDTDGVFYPAGSEIPQMGIDINVMLSDVVSIAEQQGFGQAVLYYDDETAPQTMKTGPTHLIQIKNKSGNAKFEFANANPDLDGHLNIILAIIRLFLTTNDLTTDKVSGEVNATNFASAIDRLIADSEWVGNIEDQRRKYLVAEKNIFRVVIMLLKHLAESKSWPESYPRVDISKLDPTKYELKLVFGTVKPITTEKDKAETISFLEEKGFILPFEKHIRFSDGNMGDKEAKKFEEEILAAKQAKAASFMQDQVTLLAAKTKAARGEDLDEEEEEEEKIEVTE